MGQADTELSELRKSNQRLSHRNVVLKSELEAKSEDIAELKTQLCRIKEEEQDEEEYGNLFEVINDQKVKELQDDLKMERNEANVLRESLNAMVRICKLVLHVQCTF